MTLYDSQTSTDFERARERAFVRRLRSLLLGRPHERELLSFEQVRGKVHWSDESYVGLRAVPVKAIIGSVGRYKDFDRAFLPTRAASRGRWRSIDLAYYQDVGLPPVQLYKIGEVYFVKDGNHRVSVARERGVEFIDAEVIECRAKVPLSTSLTAEHLESIGEYTGFLEWSALDQLRPEQHIEFTIPGGFSQLREHIAVHQYYLGLEHKERVERAVAVASWYDTVYMPVIRIIREERILTKFPHRSEADLYLWIMDHLYFLRERSGTADPRLAAADFVENYAQRSIIDAIRRRIATLSPGKKARNKKPAANESEKTGDSTVTLHSEERREHDSGRCTQGPDNAR